MLHRFTVTVPVGSPNPTGNTEVAVWSGELVGNKTPKSPFLWICDPTDLRSYGSTISGGTWSVLRHRRWMCPALCGTNLTGTKIPLNPSLLKGDFNFCFCFLDKRGRRVTQQVLLFDFYYLHHLSGCQVLGRAPRRERPLVWAQGT